MGNLSVLQLLTVQYGCKPLIPLEQVAQDYLSSINKTELHRKASKMQLGFAVVNTGTDKRPKYLVPIESLAAWLDAIKQTAIADHRAMHS